MAESVLPRQNSLSFIGGAEATLCDYFIVCGFDGNDLVENILGGNERECAPKPPLDRSYLAKILGRYPKTRSDRPFSNEIISLCMPKGVRFCTQKDVPTEPTFHNFANIKEDGSRIDGAALIFWEEVHDAVLCDCIQQLQADHVRRITSGNVNNSVTAAAHAASPMALPPAITASPTMMTVANGRTHHPPGTPSGGSHTLPRKGRGGRKAAAKRVSYYDSGQDTLYMSKALCVTGRLPVVAAWQAALTCLHRLILSAEPPPLPIECYVYWLLNEVPLPAPGSTLKVAFEGADLVCQRPDVEELPFFDYSLRELFMLIPVDQFLKIFSCVLFEHQVLLCSKSLHRLHLAAESLTALLFPFRWQHVYVPILPHSQSLFLEAPLPFIMGLCYDDVVPEQVFQSTVCVVDIDSGKCDMPEDLSLLPDRHELITEIELVRARFDDAETENPKGGVAAGHSRGDLRSVGQRTSSALRSSRGGGHSTRFRREDFLKRMSRSFDEDAIGHVMAAMNGDESLAALDDHSPPSVLSRSNLPPLPLKTVLRESESLAKMQAIMNRLGMAPVPLESIEQQLEDINACMNSTVRKRYFMDMKFNNAVREIFVNRFTYMFQSYDHFVIGGQQFADKETFYNCRDSMQNFDKASYLSDQPDSHLNFLAAFIETQMFATFIDWKIISQWELPDPNLEVLDRRIADLRKKFGLAMVRTPTYESCPSFIYTEEVIAKREESLDFTISPPHALPDVDAEVAAARHLAGVFPRLVDSPSLTNNTAAISSPHRSPWRRRLPPNQFINDSNKGPTAVVLRQDAGSSGGGRRRPPSTYGGAGAIDMSPAQIAHTNWKFVEELLRITKAKTKRMLVEKMGRGEAVQLGHGDLTITGVEENTLVAAFCDLLERIWAHGLIRKQGKSAFWTCLYQELQKNGDSQDSINANPYLTPVHFILSAVSRKYSTPAGSTVAVPYDNAAHQPQYHPVLTYLQGLQKDMGNSDTAPQWSTSLLRVASVIVDRMATNPGPLDNYANFAPTLQPIQQQQEESSGSAAAAPFSPKVRELRQQPASRNHRSLSRPRSPDLAMVFPPLPTHIAYDLKNVLRMTEIKTDIGYARAFIRLALERKLLHRHLKTMLSNTELLAKLYKRYAFLRCEDEREQFLYHILSLHAAEFRCFTNTFLKTKIQYQVLLMPGSGGFRLTNTAASIWILLAGSLGHTNAIRLKKNTLQFSFDHVNLGVLSTLRIGHSFNADAEEQAPPRWYLEQAIVRNELTGHTYRFACGRWFGRGVDDGSLERLLVADPLPIADPDDPSSMSSGGTLGRRTTSRDRSPSVTRRAASVIAPSSDGGPRARIQELQHELGEAVNNMVRFFYRNSERGDQRSELTKLLCGERGLVAQLEKAFLINIKSKRFFGQPSYPWDYIEKVTTWFYELFREGQAEQSMTKEQRSLIRHFGQLVVKISQQHSLGKQGKFHTFLIITIRDHILSGLLPLLAWTPATGSCYDEPSFLRTPLHLTFLTKLLNSLNDFHFDLEKSLTYGIDA